jgi:ornithine decarboxylase
VTTAIASNTLEDPDHFIIVNLADIIHQYNHWKNKLPRVTPFYAIKSNANPVIIKLLHKLGCGFDVASMKEIQTVLGCGIEPNKMVYANPCKSVKYIEFAKNAGVKLMVVDCVCEMEKIQAHYPEADILVRIKGDDSHSICKFNTKYGLGMEEIDGVFKKAVELNIRIKGVSFHIGSSCKNKNVFMDAIQKSRRVFDIGKSYGFDMNILDIGGGFSGDINSTLFNETADVINEAIDANFGGGGMSESGVDHQKLQIIAEPGRYFCSASHTLVTSVIGIKSKTDPETGETKMIYYINDGVYGVFSGAMFDYATFDIERIAGATSVGGDKLYNSIIFGPTCDSLDVIHKGCMLPLLELGDKLIIRNIGAYSIESATEFNGFPIPEKYYVLNKPP